jgi:uncharacterized protein
VRAIFDTNIYVAAFVTEGICARLLKRARQGQFVLITCPIILQEFERVLSKKFAAGKEETHKAVQVVAEAAHSVVEPNGIVAGICRDSDDDHVLDCAQAARADYLVTGDSDLLALNEFEGICILTPRDFELLFADID